MERNYQAALAEADVQKRRTAFLFIGASAVSVVIAIAAVVIAILV